MLELGTSGLMSGEGKRGVAVWPKLPRLFSTLLLGAANEWFMFRRGERPCSAARSRQSFPKAIYYAFDEICSGVVAFARAIGSTDNERTPCAP
jgi:hypothetical protein